ncbi:DDE-type integrase/transposase/recombinase [Rhizophagus irregularis DAOM 181602=DAOM 197198]|nr:DDE-type integrase/transposase/recombinase [Rhizophagus irregularis DAOM 181602=DAOM 197198]
MSRSSMHILHSQTQDFGIKALHIFLSLPQYEYKHFHHYFYGQRFTIITDHAALKYLMNMTNPVGNLERCMAYFTSWL